VGLESFDDNQWILECKISDTGLGIPEDKVATLFDSFSQVDSSTTRKYGGTGLGLAIVKKLCGLMNGDVQVLSTLGSGSCFVLNVLVQKSTQSNPVLSPVNMQALTILLVDDNAANRKVISEQLAHWGANVVEAEGGIDALAICNERQHQKKSAFFDIAFIDMEMPEMDGAILAKEFKSISAFENIKLVMMTSMGSQADANYFSELGFSAYFPKPATTSDIFDALSNVIGGGVIQGEITQNTEQAVTSKFFNARILLVEDNQINQMVAKGILKKLGFERVDIAANGFEALDSLQQALLDEPYNLILMDCQMPEMDGYEATRQIRNGAGGKNNAGISIVAMTANAMEGDREICIEAGMDDYLAKPISPDQLREKLEQWIHLSDNK